MPSSKHEGRTLVLHIQHRSTEGEADALAQGNLFAPSLNAAKHYVQTANAPNIRERKGLEVILTDRQFKEVWRGPYKG